MESFAGWLSRAATPTVSGGERFLTPLAAESDTDTGTDTGPIVTVLTEFGMSFLILISRPESIALQRMVIVEWPSNPELGDAFYRAGIGQTYALLAPFF